MMRFGLDENTIERLRGVFAVHTAVERAILYGSRAKGTHKPASDIDLTLCGDSLTQRDLGPIEEQIDDLLLPYTVDLSLFHDIEHEPLRDHIKGAGVVFYDRVEFIQRGDSTAKQLIR